MDISGLTRTTINSVNIKKSKLKAKVHRCTCEDLSRLLLESTSTLLPRVAAVTADCRARLARPGSLTRVRTRQEARRAEPGPSKSPH